MVFSVRTFLFSAICLFYAGVVFAAEISFHAIDKEFVLNPSPDYYVLNDYNSLQPPEISFDQPADVSNCKLNGQACDAAKPLALILPAGTRGSFLFTLDYQRAGQNKKITIRFLEGMPGFDVEGESRLDKPVYLGPNGFALVVSPKGEILFARRYPYRILDFKPHRVGGRTFYSFLRTSAAGVDGLISAAGERVLLDEKFKFYKVLPWPNVNLHEFTILGADHYLFFVYDQIADQFGACTSNVWVREYKKGRLIFEISTEQLRSKGLLYADVNIIPTDHGNCNELFHVNSVQVVSEDLLLLGLGRGSIILLDKKKKKPVWIFSGPQDQFSLADQLKPFFSHTATYDPQTSKLLLFVNSFYGSRKESRIVEYFIDVKKKTVQKIDFPAPASFYAEVAGSVYEENGVYSVGLGQRTDTPYDFIEFYEKKPTFKLSFKPRQSWIGTYRVYR